MIRIGVVDYYCQCEYANEVMWTNMVWSWVLQVVRPKFWMKHSTNFRTKNCILVCISLVATVHHNLDLVQNLKFYGDIRLSIQYSYENRLFASRNKCQKSTFHLGKERNTVLESCMMEQLWQKNLGRGKAAPVLFLLISISMSFLLCRTKSDHRGPSFSVPSVWPPFGETLGNLSWVTFPGCIH